MKKKIEIFGFRADKSLQEYFFNILYVFSYCGIKL